MNKAYIYIILLFVAFNSCSQLEKESQNLLENENPESVSGNYHFLSDRGIKIFLPENFKKYSLVEYQNLLKTSTKKKTYEYEIERLTMLRKMEGSFYIFFDEYSGSTFTVNTIKHFKFSRDDASQLLGYIKLTNEQEENKKNLNLTKLTAKYTGSTRQQIFKSIHKIENLKSKTEGYNTAYIISSNDKTVIMQLLTPTQVDFDAYIQKLKM
jgi:hypothetical protein